jgi:hypothetical protein
MTANLYDREPDSPQPIYGDPSAVKRLGEIRGRLWFTYGKLEDEYEFLDERPTPDRGPGRLDAGELYIVDEVPVEVNGQTATERVWLHTRRHPAGSFANGGRRPTTVAKPQARQKPLMRIDLLGRIPLFEARRPRMFAFSSTTSENTMLGRADQLLEKPGRRRALGWREAVARLNAIGYTVIPTPDGRATLASPGGHCIPELLAAFAEVADWIAAGMAGKPWPCAWCKSEAITLLVGRVPACNEHAALT